MAASNPIKIAIDRQNQTILTVLQYFISSLPTFFQGDVRDLVIQVYDPGSTTGANTAVDLTGYTLRFSIGTKPAGTVASTILAQNVNLTWVAAPGNSSITGNNAGYFSGTIDLTQAALTTALSTSDSITAYLDIDVRLNGVTQTLLQTAITVAAVVDQGIINNAPAPPSNYSTNVENDAKYVKQGPVNGKVIYFNSADGSVTWKLWVDVDGPHWQQVVPALPEG